MAATRKKSGTTEALPKIDRRKTMPHLQKAGMPSLNPAGRPKGSRNKFGEVFLETFLEDFELNGADAIQRCREDDPSTYLRVAASILPKELNIRDESTLDKILDKFGIEELDAILVAIAGGGIRAQGAQQKAKTAITAQSTRVH